MAKRRKIDLEDVELIPSLHIIKTKRLEYLSMLTTLLREELHTKYIIHLIAEMVNYGTAIHFLCFKKQRYFLRKSVLAKIWQQMQSRLHDIDMNIHFTAFRVKAGDPTKGVYLGLWPLRPGSASSQSLLQDHIHKDSKLPPEIRSLWYWCIQRRKCALFPKDVCCSPEHKHVMWQRTEYKCNDQGEMEENVVNEFWDSNCKAPHACLWKGDIVEALPKKPWEIVDDVKWQSFTVSILKLLDCNVLYLEFTELPCLG